MTTLAQSVRAFAFQLLGDWQLPWAVRMHRRGQLAQARRVYRRILARIPRHFSVLQLMGLIEITRMRYDRALQWLERAREIKPEDPILLGHVGCAFLGQRRFAEAEHWLQKARALRPDDMSICINLGQVYLQAGRPQDAVALFREAEQLAPERAEPVVAQGKVLRDTRQLEEAEQIFRGLLARFPAQGQVVYELVQILVLAGKHEAAFALLRGRRMEARFDGWPPPDPNRRRTLAKLNWQPDVPVNSVTLLLHTEAGLGDALQCFRVALLLADRGARVVLEVWPALLRLLHKVDPRIIVVARGSTLPPYDRHVVLENLPFLLEMAPDQMPPPPPLVLPAPRVAAWADRLGPRNGRLRVGFACTGNPRHGRDVDRSMRLAHFLTAMPQGVDLVCLQRVIRPEDTGAFALRPDVRLFGEQLADFADTAALIENLDLVISVDTSVAHLAASLGKPTWIMVSYIPDPRWMLDRDDSPWYPSVRLYRQGPDARWGPVLKRVAADMSARAQVPRALLEGHSTEAMAVTMSATEAQSCQ
jgi:Flp pilus assembly protein TadD